MNHNVRDGLNFATKLTPKRSLVGAALIYC